MSNVLVPKDYDVRVDLGGEIVTINLFQMGVMASAVRFRAKHGRWAPDLVKLRLTRAGIAERFYIGPEWAKTYEQLADTMDEIHADFMAQFKAAIHAAQVDNLDAALS